MSTRQTGTKAIWTNGYESNNCRRIWLSTKSDLMHYLPGRDRPFEQAVMRAESFQRFRIIPQPRRILESVGWVATQQRAVARDTGAIVKIMTSEALLLFQQLYSVDVKRRGSPVADYSASEYFSSSDFWLRTLTCSNYCRERKVST